MSEPNQEPRRQREIAEDALAAKEASDGNNSTQERLVYSVEEFAAAVGISRNSAYKAIETNEIPYRRIGRRILIPKQAVMEFLSGEAVA